MLLSKFALSNQVLSTLLTDDPDRIIPNALRLKDAKGKVDSVKQRFLGKPTQTFVGKLDSTVTDLGAGLGIGAAKAGAHLKRLMPNSSIGQRVYDEGIDTVLNTNKQRAYGLGVPLGIAGLGLAATQLDREDKD